MQSRHVWAWVWSSSWSRLYWAVTSQLGFPGIATPAHTPRALAIKPNTQTYTLLSQFLLGKKSSSKETPRARVIGSNGFQSLVRESHRRLDVCLLCVCQHRVSRVPADRRAGAPSVRRSNDVTKHQRARQGGKPTDIDHFRCERQPQSPQ